MYPVVEVPNSVFRVVTAQAVVPTNDVMHRTLVAVEGAGEGLLVGPNAEGTEGTELIRPRHIQLVPGKYAALLLGNDGLPPLTAYRVVRAALAEDDALESCADVLAWLRAACTIRGGNGNRANVPSVQLTTLTPIHPPDSVYDFVMGKVQGDLPGLRNPEPLAAANPAVGGLAPGLGADIAGLVQALVDARGQGGRDRREEGEEREPKRVSEVYRETYTTLMRHCRVENADEVAPIWRRLANSSKGEQQAIMQHEFAKVCLVRGLAPELYCPVVSTALKQAITTFSFAGNGVDDLGSGCNPFLVSYAGAKAHQEANETASLTQQLDQGVNQATLSDMRTIRDKEKVRFPRDLHQVAVTLQRYAVLTHALLQSDVGPRHPLVRSLWNLAEVFAARLPFLAERHSQCVGETYTSYPTRVLRHVQVRTTEYYQRVATTHAGFEAVDSAPTFDELLEDLGHGNFPTTRCWLPIPPAYASVFVPTSGATTGTHPTVPNTVGTTRQSGGGASGASSGISSVSGPTATSRPTAQQREVNPVPDPEFLELTLRPRLGELLRLHRPPTNQAGQEYCVSWWAKGSCNSQCSRKATHQPFASQAERARLLTHVRTHLVAAPVGGGQQWQLTGRPGGGSLRSPQPGSLSPNRSGMDKPTIQCLLSVSTHSLTSLLHLYSSHHLTQSYIVNHGARSPRKDRKPNRPQPNSTLVSPPPRQQPSSPS